MIKKKSSSWTYLRWTEENQDIDREPTNKQYAPEVVRIYKNKLKQKILTSVSKQVQLLQDRF